MWLYKNESFSNIILVTNVVDLSFTLYLDLESLEKKIKYQFKKIKVIEIYKNNTKKFKKTII